MMRLAARGFGSTTMNKPETNNTETLLIENVGPIRRAEITLGRELTVLVGPQATGKSLLSQLLKTCLDGRRMVYNLHDAGFSVETKERLINQILGEGMHGAFSPESRVMLGGQALDFQSLSLVNRRNPGKETCFYIPAHRALLLADGWPVRFADFRLIPPYVVRQYSQNLLKLLQTQLSTEDGIVFPRGSRLRYELREALNRSIFHGGELVVDKEGLRPQLVLRYGEALVAALAWTAGQRELVPLLLGLYHLVPPRRTKQADVNWVVLEEPEMGLHPKGVRAVMALVLELIHRGYRVLVSTHSPAVLDVVWGLRRLRETTGDTWLSGVARLLDLDVPVNPPPLVRTALAIDAKVYVLDFEGDKTVSQDISTLDPGSEDAVVSGWGGLSGISSEIGEVVCEAVNRAEQTMEGETNDQSRTAAT